MLNLEASIDIYKSVLLVGFVYFGNSGQQLRSLIRRKAKALEILKATEAVHIQIVALIDLVVVAELGLDRIGAEKRVGDERARQFAVHDVVAQLKREQVARELLLQYARLGRVEFHLEVERWLHWAYVTF